MTRRKLIIITLIVLLVAALQPIGAAAGNAPADKKDKIVMPQYPGGEKELHKYLLYETHYPYEAQKNELRGEVVVEFFVERSGSITGVHVVKSVAPELDAEAIRVIRKMPRWEPGTKNGKPVRAQMTIPINFRNVKSFGHYVDGETMDDGHENRSVNKDKVKLK